ncbi:unnamed protein product [Clonostachys rosea]|uniref:F-box domain-containing protein n=1 Tax=Bionectria ochroleuca TaxID=29856 RepID=A0ABY6UQM2_BIOOC|nr:unnamed protein product [Clonostachys rosea]
MAPKQNIESLPMEVLHCVFSHVGDQESIKQSRLVSRTFNDAAAPYLIEAASVCVTSKSLARLEELCDHEVFSKSITTITIILSHYDVGLATDRSLFMHDCNGRLLRNMEMRERMGAYKWRRMVASKCGKKVPPFSFQDRSREDAIQREIEQQLWQRTYFNPEIPKIAEEDFNEGEATPFQQVALRVYVTYRERCEDQERVRQGNRHIDRICSALANLPNLCNLRFDDPYLIIHDELQASDFPDLGFDRRMLEHFDCLLSPSSWCGSITTNATIVPLVEMLSELCARLGQSGIKPTVLSVQMTAPAHLRPLALSADQQAGVKLLMSRAACARIVVDAWDRATTVGEGNGRSRDEMLALCSFTKPFFAAPKLEYLRLDLRGYTDHGKTPTIDLSDLLPLENPWPHLDTVILDYSPAKTDDLRRLVALQENTVTELQWDFGWLVRGRWDEAVEVLRGFQKLNKVSLAYPRGERYGEGTYRTDNSLNEIHSYILKQKGVNPLMTEVEHTN